MTFVAPTGARKRQAITTKVGKTDARNDEQGREGEARKDTSEFYAKSALGILELTHRYGREYVRRLATAGRRSRELLLW